MSDYTQIEDYSAKDALASGDPEKVISGADIDAELAAISTAIASKANSASPTLTGTITIAGATVAGDATFSGANTHSGANTFSGTVTMSSKALNEAKGADIASAATTDIGAATGNFVDVTGTTTITSLGTVQAGTRRIVRFTGALTLTYNATSLILPGAENITTIANDVAEFVSLGSGNWVCVRYQRMGSGPVLGYVGTITTASVVAGGGSGTIVTHGLGTDDVYVTAWVTGSVDENWYFAARRVDGTFATMRGRISNTTSAGTPAAPATGQVTIYVHNASASDQVFTINYMVMARSG